MNTTTISIEDKRRLRKAVGLLGSDHEGERLAVVNVIRAIAAREKLSTIELFEQVFSAPIYEEVVDTPPPRDRPSTAYKMPPPLDELHTLVQKYGTGPMSDWELGFYEDIIEREPRGLSPKQANVIHKIIDKF